MTSKDIDDIQPNKYVVTFICATFQDFKRMQEIAANASALMQEQFVQNVGQVKEIIKPLDLQCGYCKEKSIAWIEWKTIGRPKGAPVCQVHLDKANKPDNFGEYPSIKYYEGS